MNEQCPYCGEWLVGDGYTVVRHCPNADVPQDAAPDDKTILCDFCEVEDATLMKIFLGEQHARNE